MSRSWLNLFSFKHCNLYTEKHLTKNRLQDKHQTWKTSHFRTSYININKLTEKETKNETKFLKKLSLRCLGRRVAGKPLHQDTREQPLTVVLIGQIQDVIQV